MRRLLFVVLVTLEFLAVGPLAVAGASAPELASHPKVVNRTATARRQPSTPRWLAAAESACEQCAEKCSSKAQDCKDGSVKSCYLAAVCLCQCNLDAGGCGSSKEQLQQCVDDNQKLADELN